MKKYIIPTLAAFILLATGTAFAQQNIARHDVEVRIPEVLMLRFTSGNSNAAVSNDLNLLFDLTNEFDDGLAGTYPVSNTPGWDDLKVFVNRFSTWSVSMALSNVSVPTNAVWDWSEIAVTPAPTGAASDFTLTDTTVVGSNSARGWTSLGFGPDQFALTLDGTEVAGTYTATVTYTLTAP